MPVAPPIEKLKIGLSSAALNGIKNVYWSLFTLFGMVYLTDVIGLSPALAGTILFASLMFDAVVDLPLGALLDGIRVRLRDYGSILIVSAGLSSLALTAFYFLGLFSFGSLEMALLIGTLLMFRLTFSVFDLTENAIAVRVMTNPEDRTLFASARKIAQSLTAVLLGASMGWVFKSEGDYAARIATLALGASVVLIALTAACYNNLRQSDRLGATLDKTKFAQRLDAIKKAPGCWIIAAAAFLEACATTVFMSGLIYYAIVVLKDPSWVGAAVVSMTLSQVAGQPLWLWIANRLGKIAAFGLTHGFAALAGIIFALFGQVSEASALGLICLIGGLLGGVSTLRWSLLPDIIDHAAHQNAVRVESGMIGLVICAIQTGAGVAALTLGFGLSAIGYEAGRDFLNAAPIILVVVGPFIALNGLCAVGIVLFRRQLLQARGTKVKPIRTHSLGTQV
jgi:GPH family glycoside/pentoside/hexuronide:cation symporter